ncbi:MAG: hypothetical protein JST00_19720 [Deltaproteobacteria bacterium]|nr:hypothetical protein [Deltaproteobacteria bacterium]
MTHRSTLRGAAFLGLASAALASVVAAACGNDPHSDPVPDAAADTGALDVDAGATDAAADVPVVPKGARVLGLATDLASADFVDDARLALDAGAKTALVQFAWDEIERPFDAGADAGDPDGGASTLVYQPAIHVANLVYDGVGSQAILEVDPIDGSGSRAPSELAGRALDDAELGARFDRVTDYALGELRDTKLTALVIGGSVDVALGDDAAKHAAFATFFTRAAAHARTVRPGLTVGFGVSGEGLVARRDRLSPALSAADIVAVSYLGVDAAGAAKREVDVASDLDRIVAAAPAKPIVLHAVGAPSRGATGADESTQAAFVTATFRAWDRHAGRIPVLSFRELDDAAAAAAARHARREGRSDAAFLGAVGAFGLRDADLRRKPSFAAFLGEARARGF